LHMNSEERIDKLQRIIDTQTPEYQEKIQWRNEMKLMGVFEIPLDHLIYNKYNGRILSRTKSLETQGHEIDPETKDGKALIEKLLWDSKADRNKKTMEDLQRYGQKRVGIVTKDGVIVDGNRRAMLLSKVGHTHFKAVILDVRMIDDPKEIERLETMYQMGEDEKVDYNPIEKYLKVDTMHEKGFSEKEIAECMGISVGEVSDRLAVYKTMEDYLAYLGYEGMYTQLDGREDPFINLTKWMKKYRGGESNSGFDGYDEGDVDDLQTIAFDYIRYKWEGKDFRKIAEGQKGSHFFGSKEIWTTFRDAHVEKVDPINQSEEEIDLSSHDLSATLEARDNSWHKKVDGPLKENWNKRSVDLDSIKDSSRPVDLLDRALSALSRVDADNEHFEGDDVLEKVKQINHISYELKKALGG
jgi:hypothetical protein